jgi:hypothetical protein
MGQSSSTGSSDSRDSTRSASETLFVSAFDKASSDLLACENAADAEGSSGSEQSELDPAFVSAVASMEARHLVSKGALSLFLKGLVGGITILTPSTLLFFLMVSYNEYTLNWEASVLGHDFMFLFTEVFLALALSALLVFGACVYKQPVSGQTPIFRDAMASLSAYTAFLTLLVLVSSPYTQTGVSKNLM